MPSIFGPKRSSSFPCHDHPLVSPDTNPDQPAAGPYPEPQQTPPEKTGKKKSTSGFSKFLIVAFVIVGGSGTIYAIVVVFFQ